jgi:hypothetical protein
MGKTYRRDSSHKYNDYRKGKDKPNRLKHQKTSKGPRLKPATDDLTENEY